MALQPGHRLNFDTLLRAAREQDLALVECQNQETGEMLPVICAVNPTDDGENLLIPLAQMFNVNPYDFLTPPS